MKKLLYADDLALVANGKQELQETMEEWNGLFTKHGLKLHLEKTEVLHIGHQREELDIELEGKKLTQRDSFVYLGGAVCGDGKTEREVRRRAQAGANPWRSVEGVMADRRISNRLKGKVMSTCVTPACLYGTETLALTELQQQRLQVCENNWVRKIARVTRADRRRMVELREESGVQRSLTERLARSRLQWAGHVERMADDRLPKRAAELREQGRRRRGRPRLRWEAVLKRDVKKTREEGDWKKKTQYRVGWKRLADEAVKKLLRNNGVHSPFWSVGNIRKSNRPHIKHPLCMSSDFHRHFPYFRPSQTKHSVSQFRVFFLKHNSVQRHTGQGNVPHVSNYTTTNL